MNQKSRPVQEQKRNQFSLSKIREKKKKMQLFKMVKEKKKKKKKPCTSWAKKGEVDRCSKSACNRSRPNDPGDQWHGYLQHSTPRWSERGN